MKIQFSFDIILIIKLCILLLMTFKIAIVKLEILGEGMLLPFSKICPDDQASDFILKSFFGQSEKFSAL